MPDIAHRAVYTECGVILNRLIHPSSFAEESMALHPRAGQPAQPEQLVNLEKLEQAYYGNVPDASDPQQRVSFGTSGHRGSSLRCTFNETHILAITQAICEYRTQAGTTGPLFIGKDTHALSAPAQRSALEVLAAHMDVLAFLGK